MPTAAMHGLRALVALIVVAWLVLLGAHAFSGDTTGGSNVQRSAPPPRKAHFTDAPLPDDPHHGGSGDCEDGHCNNNKHGAHGAAAHGSSSSRQPRDTVSAIVVVDAVSSQDADAAGPVTLPDMSAKGKRVHAKEPPFTAFDRKPADVSQQQPTQIPRRASPACLGALNSDGDTAAGAGTGDDDGKGAESRQCDRYLNPYPALAESSRPCRDQAYAKGKWVHDTSIAAPYPAHGEVMGSCQRDWVADGHGDAVRPEVQYRWEPEACELLPWSIETFCKALRGRDIMFAGDSLNDHWHATLVYLLGQRSDIYKREGTVAGKHACRGHAICGKYYAKPLKLYFLTNQLLEKRSMRNRNHKWWKHIRPYPILVLNSGSWMRDPTNEEREVSDAEWQKLMQGALELVQNQQYNGTVVWRTTYQGHPHCWRYDAPLTRELKPDDFPLVAPYKRYRWAAIPGRNRFSTALWRAAGAHVLDVTRLTNLMPLGHLGKHHPKFRIKNTTDCLHYCSPTPVYDTWSKLLMNLLAGNL